MRVFGSRLLCVVAALWLAGCGNVNTAPATDGSVADDDDDDDDGGSVTPTPTPGEDHTPGDGTAPETMGAWFSHVHVHTHGDDPTAGLSGSGLFFSIPFPLGWTEPWQDLMDGYPNIPTGSCDWAWGASLATSQETLSAGELSMSGPDGGSGDFLHLPLGGMQLYIMNAAPGIFDYSGGSYTLTGTGDVVPAFTATFPGPADVRVTQPALTSSEPWVIDRESDLTMKWQSEPDGLPVFVFLLQAEINPETGEPGTPQVVLCKLEDTGEGVIPASAFQMLQPSDYGLQEDIQVLKYRINWFTPPGMPAPAFSMFTAGTAARIRLE